MHLYFPYPVQNNGLFKFRSKIIAECKSHFAGQPTIHFQNALPDAAAMHRYFRMLARDYFEPKYLGELLTGDDPWKFLGSVADLDAIWKALDDICDGPHKRAYIMTNTAGHHADNAHYELFCPLNQLFFIVEYLNYNRGFPQMTWIDVDAHFGNGDKKLFDAYAQKMKTESNNLSGFSIHNDHASISDTGYVGVGYEHATSESEFLHLLSTELQIQESVQYVLVFFGTDFVMGDYGSNEQITIDAISQVISVVESKIPPTATAIYIQTGGANPDNIRALINSVISI